ncbi:hypothetical protein D9611_000485 [Ephemerocybe angulata]|uniref:Uncharacterized protein n=1 Tax=Ephemerocybe angulata TaxID=980116 RepID=A0A8H5BN06_9AGAR|nr:hypothetical protein D9611_000485 [Tulosesus angulatus]
MPEPVEPPRVIPGAPPKEPAATKSQKRRRKAKSKADAANDDAALSVAEATPAPPTHKSLEPEENLLAPEPVQTEATSPVVEDEGPLLSPIVELVNKRLKATTKKIGRITSYANTDPEKLNDDQKRTLKTLPTLEAVQKELGEVKKAIETYEADLASGLAAKRLDAERAEKTRIRNAVESTKTDLISKTSDLLAFLQLSPSLGAADGSAFFADDLERSAVSSLTNALLSDDDDRKQATLNGFLLGTGEFDGVSFTRISEIVQSLLNPPRAPTPTQDSPIDDRQQSVSAPSISGDDVQAPIPTNPTGTGSFHFMQESELEVEVEGELAEPSAHFDESESAEWVEEQPVEEAAAAVVGVANGHTPVPAVPAGGSTLDWSAENQDGDLPPIESLGPSGSATPAEQEAPAVGQANGLSPVEGEEGFAPREGHRGGRGVESGVDLGVESGAVIGEVNVASAESGVSTMSMGSEGRMGSVVRGAKGRSVDRGANGVSALSKVNAAREESMGMVSGALEETVLSEPGTASKARMVNLAKMVASEEAVVVSEVGVVVARADGGRRVSADLGDVDVGAAVEASMVMDQGRVPLGQHLLRRLLLPRLKLLSVYHTYHQ